MLVLEATLSLLFFLQWADGVALAPVPVPHLQAAWVAERAWRAPDSAWTDPLEKRRLESAWREQTECCVAFSGTVWEGCLAPTRVAYPKSLWQKDGLKTVFAVASCPAR